MFTGNKREKIGIKFWYRKRIKMNKISHFKFRNTLINKCRERDSNPHGRKLPTDFKSVASSFPPSRLFINYISIFFNNQVKLSPHPNLETFENPQSPNSTYEVFLYGNPRITNIN